MIPGEIQIGYWYTYCCHLDLEEIKTEEDLQDIRQEIEDDEPLLPHVWPTKLEALQEMRQWWINGQKQMSDKSMNQTSIDEIDLMIKELDKSE